MKQNSSISAKEPPQSFVPGLLITFLKEKGYGDSKGTKTKYNQSAKEDYLNLKPEEQAEIFAEFYSKYSARDESGKLIHQTQKQELDDGIAQHIEKYQGAKKEEIPQPPKDKAASKGWYESLQNSLYSSLATLGTLAVGAGFLTGAAADDPTRGSTYPTFDPTSRPTFVPTIFPTYSPSVNPTVAPSNAPSFSQVPTIISTIQNAYNTTFNSTSNATVPTPFPSPSPSLVDVAGQGHHPERDWDNMVGHFEHWGREHPLALSGVVVGITLVVGATCCFGYMCRKTREQEKVVPHPNPIRTFAEAGVNTELNSGRDTESIRRIEIFNLHSQLNESADSSVEEGDAFQKESRDCRSGAERIGQGRITSNRLSTAGPFGGRSGH